MALDLVVVFEIHFKIINFKFRIWIKMNRKFLQKIEHFQLKQLNPKLSKEDFCKEIFHTKIFALITVYLKIIYKLNNFYVIVILYTETLFTK